MAKIKMGLEKVHYAMYEEPVEGAQIGTWGTPSPLKGAVSYSSSQVGDEATFYADNGGYITYTQDNGLEGDLLLALFPRKFLMDILGWIEDENGVLVQTSGTAQKPFALLFEVGTDDKPLRVCLPYCTGSAPSRPEKTNESAPTLEGETMAVKAKVLDYGKFKTAKFTIDSAITNSTEAFEAWFGKVYEPTLPQALESQKFKVDGMID